MLDIHVSSAVYVQNTMPRAAHITICLPLVGRVIFQLCMKCEKHAVRVFLVFLFSTWIFVAESDFVLPNHQLRNNRKGKQKLAVKLPNCMVANMKASGHCMLYCFTSQRNPMKNGGKNSSCIILSNINRVAHACC